MDSGVFAPRPEKEIKTGQSIASCEIRQVRKRRGLTQKQLAIVCDLEQYQISRIEIGRLRPDRSTRERIARVLATAADSLFPDHQARA